MWPPLYFEFDLMVTNPEQQIIAIATVIHIDPASPYSLTPLSAESIQIHCSSQQ